MLGYLLVGCGWSFHEKMESVVVHRFSGQITKCLFVPTGNYVAQRRCNLLVQRFILLAVVALFALCLG